MKNQKQAIQHKEKIKPSQNDHERRFQVIKGLLSREGGDLDRYR